MSYICKMQEIQFTILLYVTGLWKTETRYILLLSLRLSRGVPILFLTNI
jgi:hypothetical protein